MDDELYVVWNTLNDAVPFTTKSPLIVALPVTPSEPVICAEPVNGNGETYPVKYDAVNAYDDETTLFEPYGPNTPDAVMNDDVCAVITYDAVAVCIAYDDVPNNDPVRLALDAVSRVALINVSLDVLYTIPAL